MPLRLHDAKLMLHAQQCAENVSVEGGSVAFSGLRCYRARLAFGAGVIDGHIQAPNPRDCLIYQAAHIVLVAYIGPHKFCFRAKFAELANQPLAFVIMPAGNNNACAFLREGQRGGSPDTCECTSNQNNGFIHRSSPRRLFFSTLLLRDPIADVGRTVTETDAFSLRGPKEANDIYLDQVTFLEVQRNL